MCGASSVDKIEVESNDAHVSGFEICNELSGSDKMLLESTCVVLPDTGISEEVTWASMIMPVETIWVVASHSGIVSTETTCDVLSGSEITWVVFVSTAIWCIGTMESSAIAIVWGDVTSLITISLETCSGQNTAVIESPCNSTCKTCWTTQLHGWTQVWTN